MGIKSRSRESDHPDDPVHKRSDLSKLQVILITMLISIGSVAATFYVGVQVSNEKLAEAQVDIKKLQSVDEKFAETHIQVQLIDQKVDNLANNFDEYKKENIKRWDKQDLSNINNSTVQLEILKGISALNSKGGGKGFQ